MTIGRCGEQRARVLGFVVDLKDLPSHLPPMPKIQKADVELLRTWLLSPAATFGSSVRTKGILQEVRARLAPASKKALSLDGGDLAMPPDDKAAYNAAVSAVERAMSGIEALPIIPREIQDILAIQASERHRWLNDGRLPSAGTRTVKLNGRARQITFHVFDPKVGEDLLDRGVVDEWRAEDAEAEAVRRQRAAGRAEPKRTSKRAQKNVKGAPERHRDTAAATLTGWEEFDVDGLLRWQAEGLPEII